MGLLFFALHLPTLSPPLLSQLKQCLLELANLYAFSSPNLNSKRCNFNSSLHDLIGLCYFRRSPDSSSNELKVAYSPRGRCFNLCDFHYAVNHLPSDCYSPLAPEDSESFFINEVEISSILNNEVFYSAGGKEIEKKIILISSFIVGNMDSNAKKVILDAAERCVSVEFVFLEQKSSQLSDISENINKFRGQICDLENCSFNAYLSDEQIFNGLAKKWLKELKENTEEPLQAHFLFQKNIIGSVNQICCRLCNSINQIMNSFNHPCKMHRCHDSQRDNCDGYEFDKGLLHHVKKDNVDLDSFDNNSKIYENGLPIEVSLLCGKDLCQLSSAVIFNIMDRTSLASLSEGVAVGRPYFVTTAVIEETDIAVEENDMCQLNNRLFQGLCHALDSMNQGLICWSYCNLEMMRETAFIYYYILQPSDCGLMLLRRLAGAEEFLPFPDTNVVDSSIAKDIDSCIRQCLGEVELRDYNPVQHIGGFHQKLNQLIKESSQPGLAVPEISSPPDSNCLDEPVPLQPNPVRVITAFPDEDVVLSGRHTEVPPVQLSPLNQADEDDKGITRLAQKWEQLIVGGIPRMDLTLSEPSLEKARTSPQVTHRPLDTRTSNILERLGNPKQKKTSLANTDMIFSNMAAYGNGTKENHIPIDVDAPDHGLTTTNNLIKPIFQRLKRKLR